MNNKFELILFSFFILVLLGSCKDKKGSTGWEADVENIDDLCNAFKKEINIDAEIFIDDTTRLLRPSSLVVLKGYMVIYDRYGDYIFSVFDMKNKSLIGRFLQQGKGPDEYLHPRLISYGTDSIMVLDSYKQKIAIYSLKKVENCDNIPDRVISFTHTNPSDAVNKAYYFNKSLFTTGQFKQGRYSMYDTNGSAKYSFGTYPSVSSKVPTDNYHMGFIYGANEDVESSSQLDKIACLTESSLSIYKFDNQVDTFSQIFNIQWHSESVMEATYRNGKPYVIRFGKGRKVGAGHLAANDKYLFFPFSSDDPNELREQGISGGYYDYIFVMDWNGFPVAKLKLNMRIKYPLEMDKEGNYLYSIYTDTDTGFLQVVRFDISFLNK
jgi:hypothetical protein